MIVEDEKLFVPMLIMITMTILILSLFFANLFAFSLAYTEYTITCEKLSEDLMRLL